MAVNKTLPIKSVTYNGTEIPIAYDTPSIEVSSGGLITASANGKSATQQLSTQSGKTVTPTESEQTAVASGKYTTGDIKVGAVSSTYVGSGIAKQAAKSITPTKSTQTAVASGVYTTGAVTVGAIPSEYIIPSGSQTLTENNKTFDVTNLASVTTDIEAGGLPTGFTAIATGSYQLSSQVQGGATFTITHDLGYTPDLFMVYATANVATTYSMLSAMRCTQWGWRGSTYLGKCWYHGNSTTTATGADVTTSYGVKTLSATQAVVTTYSNSSSYYWRTGTYKWIAIKF